MSLSDRIRPNSEAAPWVCEEVKKIERQLAEVTKQRDALIAFLECEMNWSFFRAEYQLGENPTQHQLNGNKIREYLQAKGWEAK